jgi:hypothetical protein
MRRNAGLQLMTTRSRRDPVHFTHPFRISVNLAGAQRIDASAPA